MIDSMMLKLKIISEGYEAVLEEFKQYLIQKAGEPDAQIEYKKDRLTSLEPKYTVCVIKDDRVLIHYEVPGYELEQLIIRDYPEMLDFSPSKYIELFVYICILNRITLKNG